MPKTLLFRVDTEIDSLLVVIPWTDELKDMILQRRETMVPLTKEDNLCSVELFWYGLEVYGLPPEWEEDVTFDDGSVKFVEKTPSLNKDRRFRIDGSLMSLGVDEFVFKFALKHTTEYLETSSFSYTDEELFPKTS